MSLDILVLAPMFSVAILFLILRTKMWFTSISTTVHATTTALVLFSYANYSAETTLGIALTGVFINITRGLFTTERDRLIKRSCNT
jgi:hypothetical protein